MLNLHFLVHWIRSMRRIHLRCSNLIIQDACIVRFCLFVTDVFPYLIWGAAAAPKRTIKSAEPTSASSGGLDGLPQEDISGKITPTLLKGLESTDWKARLESIEVVNKVLEEANKRFQPNGTDLCFCLLLVLKQ
ncbi:protein MOR1-like isoform X2 [Humulus lupulus]|uniref:protein MOR1-like isoform X2 n=1 Tax=Humulus lupulus TaxID=3486 RepID=UPI002B4092FD|nr:protein MOR1-like isoform X2 [Humulus lupulus]